MKEPNPYCLVNQSEKAVHCTFLIISLLEKEKASDFQGLGADGGSLGVHEGFLWQGSYAVLCKWMDTWHYVFVNTIQCTLQNEH